MGLFATAVVLVFAGIGAWQVIGFARYRSYFREVDAIVQHKCPTRISQLSPDAYARVDDAVRRAYFAKKSLEDAAYDAMDEIARIVLGKG